MRMLPYFVIILLYLLTFELVYFFNLTIALSLKLLLVGVALFIYRKDFKFRIKFDFFAIAIGVLIFLIWVFMEGKYPVLYDDPVYSYTIIDITIKLLISVILAPVVEEFFTRFFLIRYLVDRNWKNVKMGTYTASSFIITVLFFGFSHSRWLPGLITAILLNLLLYKRKNIESCILAHSVANLVLGIYVIYTGAWWFW